MQSIIIIIVSCHRFFHVIWPLCFLLAEDLWILLSHCHNLPGNNRWSAHSFSHMLACLPTQHSDSHGFHHRIRFPLTWTPSMVHLRLLQSKTVFNSPCLPWIGIIVYQLTPVSLVSSDYSCFLRPTPQRSCTGSYPVSDSPKAPSRKPHSTDYVC